MAISCHRQLAAFVFMWLGIACLSGATTPEATNNLGPYNLTFLEGGVGLTRPLAADSPALAANGSWSLSGWLQPTLEQSGDVLIAAVGGTSATACRCLALHDGKLQLRVPGAEVTADRPLHVATWQAIAATYDGRSVQLYVDGQLAGSRPITKPLPAANPVLMLAPTGSDSHFGGSLAHFQLQATALSQDGVRQLAGERPDFALIVLQNVGAGWPWQEHAWRGLQVPQDPWTLPKANTPPSHPVPSKDDAPALPLNPSSDHSWTIGAWKLAEAPRVAAGGPQLSIPEFNDTSWYPAVVPGTVLTTLIARGVYPDPTYGLNNMAIPESLSRQDYWYRTSFDAPSNLDGRRFTLTFKGINYYAEVWLNGTRLGQIKGAFTRGIFDVTGQLKSAARNVLAVRVSPPPHPGIPHEESIAAGPGENGGNLAIDGPTFVAAEGWDWIPGIRDRNTGLWQEVELEATGALKILDPHIVTRLPLPKTDAAEVSVEVGIENHRGTQTGEEVRDPCPWDLADQADARGVSATAPASATAVVAERLWPAGTLRDDTVGDRERPAFRQPLAPLRHPATDLRAVLV
jgi:hypothetical protein